MQDNSWTTVGRLLRVAASFNPAVKRDCAKARSPLLLGRWNTGTIESGLTYQLFLLRFPYEQTTET